MKIEENKINSLTHIAFIMDGNGRWAKARNLPRTAGHKVGCERVSDIYQECIAQGIKVISLYAFSTENWNRPKTEISLLFKYLEHFFKREINNMINDGTKIVVSGDITRLPEKTQTIINNSIEATNHCQNHIFNICLNYGGKAEIIRACKQIYEDIKLEKIDIDQIDETKFNQYLYTKDLPPVDLLIRTSGEMRISNFMLWQLAYAEMIFDPTPWPDFDKKHLRQCLDTYKSRDRRFGRVKDDEEKSDQ